MADAPGSKAKFVASGSLSARLRRLGRSRLEQRTGNRGSRAAPGECAGRCASALVRLAA